MNITQFTADDVARLFPFPDESSDKYSRGVVGSDTGSETYPGAALLSVSGALHAGAGMVRFVGAEQAKVPLLSRYPSVVCSEGRVNAWVVGSGWGSGDHADRLTNRLGDGLPTVIDADALTALQDIDSLPDNTLLTPHAGELARMLGVERKEVEADPAAHALQAAHWFGATVLVKGSKQYCAEPGGGVLQAVAGPAWTAQAGSGDVLAGLCGALLAAGLTAHEAGAVGASLQAMTAEHFPGPFPPDVMAERLADVIVDLS